MNKRRIKGNFMKVKMLKTILAIVMCVCVTSSCKTIDTSMMEKMNNSKNSSTPVTSVTDGKDNEDSSKSEENTPKLVEVDFVAVGDNLIHSSLYNQAKARATAKGNKGYDFDYAYENIKDSIKKADIAIINQETPISSIHEPSDYPLFNSPTELGKKVVSIGFDVINLANNHTMDKGADGLLSTLDFWENESSVLTVGAYTDEQDRDNIRVDEINGIKFSFVGFTEPTNGLVMPASSKAIWMLGEDEALIEKQVREAEKISDFVVVNVHWGNEYTHEPTDRQRYLAKKLVEWGADAIMGHHPHVIQPVEYIKKPDGSKALVAYSLGNFISAQDQGVRMIGGMLNYTVKKDLDTGVLTIKKVKFNPVVTHYGSSYRDITVYPFSKYTKELANSHGVRKNTPNFSYDYIQEVVESVIDKKFL